MHNPFGQVEKSPDANRTTDRARQTYDSHRSGFSEAADPAAANSGDGCRKPLETSQIETGFNKLTGVVRVADGTDFRRLFRSRRVARDACGCESANLGWQNSYHCHP